MPHITHIQLALLARMLLLKSSKCRGLGMSTIQYGLPGRQLPKDCVFSKKDQITLAAEVGRLEEAQRP